MKQVHVNPDGEHGSQSNGAEKKSQREIEMKANYLYT